MIRRYIAATLIVLFFSYAAYLIVTDGGKPNTIISFAKLNNNVHNKFLVLTGQKEAKLAPHEKAITYELELERKKAAAGVAKPVEETGK